MSNLIGRLSLGVAAIATGGAAVAWHQLQRDLQRNGPARSSLLAGADTAIRLTGTAAQLPDPMVELLGKLIVTAVFGAAALYVVLSRRYDNETKKWAFSVLTLIAGVWLGTAT